MTETENKTIATITYNWKPEGATCHLIRSESWQKLYPEQTAAYMDKEKVFMGAAGYLFVNEDGSLDETEGVMRFQWARDDLVSESGKKMTNMGSNTSFFTDETGKKFYLADFNPGAPALYARDKIDLSVSFGNLVLPFPEGVSEEDLYTKDGMKKILDASIKQNPFDAPHIKAIASGKDYIEVRDAMTVSLDGLAPKMFPHTHFPKEVMEAFLKHNQLGEFSPASEGKPVYLYVDRPGGNDLGPREFVLFGEEKNGKITVSKALDVREFAEHSGSLGKVDTGFGVTELNPDAMTKAVKTLPKPIELSGLGRYVEGVKPLDPSEAERAILRAVLGELSQSTPAIASNIGPASGGAAPATPTVASGASYTR